MSDKDRQKKDGRDKNKDNQAMRAANKDQRQQAAAAPQQAKAQSNLTDTEPGAAGTK
jgi:nitrous oxide reductase